MLSFAEVKRCFASCMREPRLISQRYCVTGHLYWWLYSVIYFWIVACLWRLFQIALWSNILSAFLTKESHYESSSSKNILVESASEKRWAKTIKLLVWIWLELRIISSIRITSISNSRVWLYDEILHISITTNQSQMHKNRVKNVMCQIRPIRSEDHGISCSCMHIFVHFL